MNKLLKNSYTYKIFIIISNWFNKIFSESLIVQTFLKENNTREIEEETIFVRLINKIILFFQKISSKIKLDKLFENSIFAKPMIWLSITVFLVPFLPTMIVLAMVICTSLSLTLKILITPDFKLKYFKINAWILLFILVTCISAATSISLQESRNICLLLVAFILFYFVIINVVENKRQLKFLLYLFIIGAVISAIYGIYQYMFGDLYSQAWIDKNMFEDIRMRVYSTFENPNVYGEYLILVIPIIVGLIWTEKGWKKKMFLIATFGITLVALTLTFSRGCWLGIIFALAILLVIINKRFIWLGVLGLLLLPFVLPEAIMNRFLSIGDMSDSSTSYRVYIWLGTIAMLKDYWFSGIGLGITSFNTIYPIYSYNSISAPHSHNLYLQLIVEYGIIGLVVMVGIIYNFCKEIAVNMKNKKDILTAGILAGLLGFMLQSMFDYTWYNYRVVLIFWSILAFGMLSTRFSKEELLNH